MRFIISSLSVLIIIGCAWHFAPWIMNWFGHLPGDFRFEGSYGRVYIPFSSMLIICTVIFLISQLFRLKPK